MNNKFTLDVLSVVRNPVCIVLKPTLTAMPGIHVHYIWR